MQTTCHILKYVQLCGSVMEVHHTCASRSMPTTTNICQILTLYSPVNYSHHQYSTNPPLTLTFSGSECRLAPPTSSALFSDLLAGMLSLSLIANFYTILNRKININLGTTRPNNTSAQSKNGTIIGLGTVI